MTKDVGMDVSEGHNWMNEKKRPGLGHQESFIEGTAEFGLSVSSSSTDVGCRAFLERTNPLIKIGGTCLPNSPGLVS